jgi:hypothetical protein
MGIALLHPSPELLLAHHARRNDKVPHENLLASIYPTG